MGTLSVTSDGQRYTSDKTMTEIDWNTVFDEVHAEPGASHEDIVDFISTALKPLTHKEVERIYPEQQNPFPKRDPLHSTWQPFDPSKWSIPNCPFPNDYLQLLRWANGAECRSGDRWFQFFPTTNPSHGVRAMMLAYHVPQYMSGAVPFAFNGGGTFYMFDMREPARNGEYPIVCCGAGALGFDDAYTVKIADSFLAACRGKADIDDLRFAEPQ